MSNATLFNRYGNEVNSPCFQILTARVCGEVGRVGNRVKKKKNPEGTENSWCYKALNK